MRTTIVKKVGALAGRSKYAQLICIALALSLAFSCSTMFDTEYYVETIYEAGYVEEHPESGILEVRNYSGMCDAFETLVMDHADKGVIRAMNYTGSVYDDVYRAINYIMRDTPLGAYAVEYIAPDIKTFLTYYDIEIEVYYLKTQDELAEVPLPNSFEIYEILDQALANFTRRVVFELRTIRLSEAALLAHLTTRMDEDAGIIPEYPEITITGYPSMTSLRKFVVVEFRYSYSYEALLARRLNNIRRLEQAKRIEEEQNAQNSDSDLDHPIDALNRIDANRFAETNEATEADALLSGYSDVNGSPVEKIREQNLL